jgi:hypothetical protein
MKRAIIVAAVLLSACSPIAGPSNTTATGSPSPTDVMPSAQPASPDQVAVARQAVTSALQQLRQGRGVSLTGDSYIDSDGVDISAHITGTIAPDGPMDLFISVPFSQGTDVFEVRSLAGHEFTWDPNTTSWNTAALGEPAASGISAVDPLFMNYPTVMSLSNVRVAPDDLVNGSETTVYEVTVTSSDQNDQVTTRLWLARDSGALLQEGVNLSSQAELPVGLGFNGLVLIQFQPAQTLVSVSAPAVS